ARLDQVLDGAREVPPALEVQGELRGNVRRPVTVMSQQLFARVAVEQDSALADQLAIQRILVERVRKAIPRRYGAVGQFFFAARFNQTMNSVEAIKPLLQR